jgi:YggT family protein
VNIGSFLQVFISLFVTALFIVVLGRVLMSWINPRYEGAVARFLFDTTEPLLSPIRRVLPSTGMIDLAPMILVMVLLFLMRMLFLR